MKNIAGGDEEDRLAALESLRILDTAPEPVYDEVVQLAASVCEAPVSLITLLDERRQWFKARVGFTAQETPRSVAFCDYAIRENALLMVRDARQDPRFRENPTVVGEPGIRFYAGMPIAGPQGHLLGTLCVVDTVPRSLTSHQRSALTVLAGQVSAQFALRAQRNKLREVFGPEAKVDAGGTASPLLLGAFLSKSPLASFIRNEQGRFLYYNPAFAERFGISQDAWIGKTEAEVWPQEFAVHRRAVDMAVLRAGELQVVEESSPGPGGTILHWRTHKFPFLDASGEFLLAGMSLDITPEKNAGLALAETRRALASAQERIRELEMTDAMTGLGNRGAFEERLQEQRALSMRHGNPFSLLLLDLDDFSQYNQAFGREAGDAALCHVGRLLAECSRATDRLYRLGGEEFALLLPNTTLPQAMVVAERLRSLVEHGAWEHGSLTVSGGVVGWAQADAPTPPTAGKPLVLELHPSGRIARNPAAPRGKAEEAGAPRAPEPLSPSLLVEQASRALDRAKALGKNVVVAYEPALDAAELAS